MAVLFKRRPQPKFKLGRHAIIPPESHSRVRKPRYLLVDERRWVPSTKEWVYSGGIYMVEEVHLVFKYNVYDVSEDKLRKMRSGDWE